MPTMASAVYATLGVPPTATVTEIRAAYRRLAMLHHPDRNAADPRAADRFKVILRAYRVALAAAANGGTAPPERPAGPRPDRFACGQCGDSFPFAEPCPRCDVPTWDRVSGPPVHEERPDVRAFVASLEARPVDDGPTWEERLPVPGLVVGGCLVAAAGMAQIGPLGVALLFVGFATYVTGLEVHRRASLALTR